jgi:hypothetical protein
MPNELIVFNPKSAKSKKLAKATQQPKGQRALKKANGKAGKNARNAHTAEGVPAKAIYETIAAGDSIERELAKALSVPNMFPSFRVQDGYASFPTNAASPFLVVPAVFSAVDGSAPDTLGIPADELWAIATRDPRCALRYYDPIGGSYQYSLIGSEGVDAFDIPAGETFPIERWRGDSVFQPHGPVLYTGFSDGEGQMNEQKWTLGQGNQTLVIGGLPVSQATGCWIEALQGDEANPYYAQATTDAGGVLTLDFIDFTRIEDNVSLLPPIFHWSSLKFDQVTDNGYVRITGNGPILRQLGLGDWEDVENIFEKLRFNALNIMFSNTANEMDKNGYCAGWQLPSNMDWLGTISDGFEALANKPQASRMLAKNGIHGFWKSTCVADWEYLETGGSNDATGSSSYELYAHSDTLIMCVKIPNKLGRAGYLSVFSATEQRHESPWFGDGFPTHERRHFERALEIQGRMPQWHENPFHISDIFKWIGKNKEKIKKTGSIFNAVTGGTASRVLGPINDLLDTWF